MSSHVKNIFRILARRYPDAGFGTDMGDPFHTLIATLLSAQTTDKQVLKIYPAFREKFPNASSLADASIQEIEAKIKTVGLHKIKARHLHALGKQMDSRLRGNDDFPHTMEGLTALPGVGRKTASIVLACCFGVPAIAVDTHVHRVANRLGLVRTKTPTQTEKHLLETIPKDLWIAVNRVMVPFGREVCTARSPKCYECPLARFCPYPKKTSKPV